MSIGPETSPSADRCGVLAGGNFIVDTVIRIDAFPREEMLANIIDETPSNGGGPYNVLRDLAALGARFPLSAIGLVGDDENGRWIRRDCEEHGIDCTQLQVDPEAPTSHTQVMTVRGSGRRTFFHRRGANRKLSSGHFDFAQSQARVFYLGYLMLLDGLDSFDEEQRTGASRVLEAAKQAGLTTVVDLVSVDHPDFRKVVQSAIPWIDHLIVNEVEAGRLYGQSPASDDRGALEAAADHLLSLGVLETVVIHTTAGAVLTCRTEGTHALGSLIVPPVACKGANGAGDAFAAGYISGLHDQLPATKRLQLGTCVAATSLADFSPSASVLPQSECITLSDQYGHRHWPRSLPPPPTAS